MLSALKKLDGFGKKHVTFSEDTKKEEKTSFFRSEKKQRFSAIRKLWFQYAENNEYEQLKQYLVSCTEKGIAIEDFFSQEGRLILFWTINHSNATALKFIDENIPHALIRELLSQNDHILQSFLFGESGMDERHWTTSKDLKARQKKFELLLKMGAKTFIEESLSKNQSSASERLIADFNAVLEKYVGEIEPILLDKSPTIK